MNELQYLDIFNQQRDIIDSKSAQVINNHRDGAVASFKKIGFPTNNLEDYKYFDISAQFISDWAMNLNRVPVDGNPYSAFNDIVPDLSGCLYFMLNDSFHRGYAQNEGLPEGVFIGSLCEFAELYPLVCEQYYGKIADIEANGLTAFNTMFAQDGFVVYIPENIIIDSPIQLVNILESDENLLVNRRNLVIVEKNAEVKLVIYDRSVDDSQYLVTQVDEIFAGENAIIEYYQVEENSDSVTRMASAYIDQKDSSNVLVNNSMLNCGKTRNNYHINLGGLNAGANIGGMVIAGSNQLADNFVYMDHAKPYCQSNQLFKYVMMDKSVGSFCGMIVVEKDAQKTVAYQNNRNLCVSADARMYSKPQLEIYADDVKCSHGLTTGQLDEDALFYMCSRGIDAQQARLMLMEAFTADVIEHIRIGGLKDWIQSRIEIRFKGENSRRDKYNDC